MDYDFKVGDKARVHTDFKYYLDGEFTITGIYALYTEKRYAEIESAKDNRIRYKFLNHLELVNKWRNICI